MTNKATLAFMAATIVIVVGLMNHSQVGASSVSSRHYTNAFEFAKRLVSFPGGTVGEYERFASVTVEENRITRERAFETPEEILRTEIITEGRSPIDGKLLTAGEYAQLQAQIKTRPYPPQLNTKVKQSVFLLRLRKILLKIFPFLDI